MTLPSTLRLDKLTLRNFRCFTECKVDLHPSLTVLIAENGQGKTAVLDAIGIALGLFVDTVAGTKQWHGFERSDIRRFPGPDKAMTAAVPVELTAHGTADGDRLSWGRALAGPSARVRTTIKDADSLRRAAERMRSRLEGFATGGREAPPPLPLVAFYGTGRLWSTHRLTEGKRAADPSAMGRLSAYADCLSSSSSFKTFVVWYATMANAVRSPTAIAYGPNERPERLLAAVRTATEAVLAPTGWHSLDWDFQNKELVIEHPDRGRLPLSVLSDGVRNMIALVADLAHRCVRLNPHFGYEAARLTPGILLIDEVDMHLHPGWQQLVVELLQRAFPAMQMVLSTHSPHVLSTVDMDSIRVVSVRDGTGNLDTPRFQTRGVESADVLAMVMKVDPVPLQIEPAQWVHQYRLLLQTGHHESAAGRKLWVRLLGHFAPADHPVLQELATLRRFQDFKKQHIGAQGG